MKNNGSIMILLLIAILMLTASCRKSSESDIHIKPDKEIIPVKQISTIKIMAA